MSYVATTFNLDLRGANMKYFEYLDGQINEKEADEKTA